MSYKRRTAIVNTKDEYRSIRSAKGRFDVCGTIFAKNKPVYIWRGINRVLLTLDAIGPVKYDFELF
jgi:hypothetical protein